MGIDSDCLQEILFCLGQISHFVIGQTQIVYRGPVVGIVVHNVVKLFESRIVQASFRQDSSVVGFGGRIVGRHGMVVGVKNQVVAKVKALGDGSKAENGGQAQSSGQQGGRNASPLRRAPAHLFQKKSHQDGEAHGGQVQVP